MKNTDKSKYFWLVLFLISLTLPSVFFTRNQNVILLFFYLLSFGVYFKTIVSECDESHFYFGVLARCVLFLTLPNLSDDIYRFLWDGNLVKLGINPYAHVPEVWLHTHDSLSFELYEKLNSQEKYTVYPPINQFIFWLSVVFSSHTLLSTGIIRLFLLTADILTFRLLKKMKVKNAKKIAYIFFLNPLVILEGVGNIHFEGIVIFFLTLTLYYWYNQKYFISALGFAMALGTKLLPLIFLPFLTLKSFEKKEKTYIFYVLLFFILSMLPMVYDGASFYGFFKSLDLYFRNFEFNASLYFLVKYVVTLLTGYHYIKIVGPILSFFSFLSLIFITLYGYKKGWKIEKIMCFCWAIYLVFATTIHPWYVLPSLVLGLLSGYFFPLVWTLVVFLSYFGYNEAGYQPPYFLIILEYTLVALSMVCNDYIKKWIKM